MRLPTLLRPHSPDEVQREGAFLSPRRLPAAALLALAVLVGLAGCGRREGAAPAPGGAPAAQGRPAEPGGDRNGQQQAAMTVTVSDVRKSEITRSISATGSIQPWQEVVIGPEVGGYRVSAVLVDVGDRVKRGQVLVRLSSDLLEAEVASRRAAVRSAEADALNASADLRRGEAIRSSGALSEADLERLRAEQISAQARVETARSELQTAELRLKYTSVTAPDDGVVSARTVTVGQVAQMGTEMLRMLRQNRVEWRAEVPEAQLSLVKPGQKATIVGPDGREVEGKVRAVAPTVGLTNRTALVYVDIERGDARAGMFARGRIDVGQGDALLLPIASIVMQDGYSYVFVLKDGGKVERRRVETLAVRGDDMEIAGGVQPGETIAVKGAGFLKDGDTVTVARADGAAAPSATVQQSPPSGQAGR